jgi:hypothetical protein
LAFSTAFKRLTNSQKYRRRASGAFVLPADIKEKLVTERYIHGRNGNLERVTNVIQLFGRSDPKVPPKREVES